MLERSSCNIPCFNGDDVVIIFPKLNKEWKEIDRKDCFIDERHKYNYSFLTFEKNS